MCFEAHDCVQGHRTINSCSFNANFMLTEFYRLIILEKERRYAQICTRAGCTYTTYCPLVNFKLPVDLCLAML